MGPEVGRDVFAVALALAALAALGAPFTALLPRQARGFARLAGAPVLGFAAYAVLVTVLYRWGVPPALTLAGGSVAGLGVWLWRAGSPRASRDTRVLLMATAVVALLALAPKWTGGAQFTIFQGNQLDQRNYVAAALSYQRFSQAELTAAGVVFNTGFAEFGARNLEYRPAVALMFAGLGRVWPGRLTEQTYTYMALLSTLWWLAAVLVSAHLWQAGIGRLALLAAGLALGFFGQYVLDINAWSELAALPVALVGLVAVIDLGRTAATADEARGRSVLLSALAFAGLAYLYPEALLPYALAAAAALRCLVSPAQGWRALGALSAVVQAAVVTLLLCVPCWSGTLGFLWNQAVDSSRLEPPPYYRFFQRYLWAIDADPLARTLYSVVSTPIDFVAGASGLYMLGLPAAALGDSWKLAWKLGEGLLLLGLVGAAGAAARRTLAAGEASAALVAGALAALAVPVVPALMQQYWLAGKLLSMVTPLLYLLLVLPLLETPSAGRPAWWRWPAGLYVAAQLAFGLARPVYAAQPDGVHYSWPPYPSIRGGFLKTDYTWDFRERLARLAGCRHVRLDVRQRLLECYAEMALEDHGLSWSSRRHIRAFDTDGHLTAATRGQAEPPDCVLTDTPQAAGGTLRIVRLQRGTH